MLQTTLVYGLTFCISLIFCRIYEKKYEILSTFKKVLIWIAILIPPILIATVRYGVGIDYFSYISNYNTIAKHFSFLFLFKFYSHEPLYVLITYIGHLITGNYVGAFLMYSIIFMIFSFEGIRYYRDKISMSLALFIFYMTYYLVFYNMLRQMISVVIVLFASRYLFEKKFWKYLFWIIIAGCFHKTAYTMIILYLFTFNLKNEKLSKIYYILMILSPIYIYILSKLILMLFSAIGIYGRYLKIEFNFSFGFMLYLIPTLGIVWIYRNKILEMDFKYEIFIKILFLQLPAQLMGCFVEYSDRMAVYFGIFQCIVIPLILRVENIQLNNLLPKLKGENLINKIIIQINVLLNNNKFKLGMIICWYLFYYFVLYILMNSNEVYPYTSLLDIDKFPKNLIK